MEDIAPTTVQYKESRYTYSEQLISSIQLNINIHRWSISRTMDEYYLNGFHRFSLFVLPPIPDHVYPRGAPLLAGLVI